MIASLKEELTTLQSALEEKTRHVDQVKKTTLKASKVLEQALKEITLRVWPLIRNFFPGADELCS